MSDYPLALINALNDDYVKEYSYFYIISLFIIFILGFYINIKNSKRINRIEKYLEEINVEFREHYYFRCEEKLKEYFKESYDNLYKKIINERDYRLEDIENIKKNIEDMKQEFSESLLIVEEKTNSLIDTKISIVKNDISHAILIVADEANKAITSTNSKVEEHNIQENAYQTFIGTGEYAQEGNYKYTAEIKIVNKGLHTFGENKRWMESLDDASVAYKDSLMSIFNLLSSNWYNMDFRFNMGSMIGFTMIDDNNKYTTNLLHISNTNDKCYMVCRKYEWDGFIDFHIKVKKLYDNTNLYQSSMKESIITLLNKDNKINWKKSLEVC